MKRVCRSLALFTLALASSASGAIIGYANVTFYPGDNLFHSTLANSDDTLAHYFPSAPEHSTVSLWDPASHSYGTPSEFVNGAWTLNFELSVGVGARLQAPIGFTATFVGTALNHDGVPLDSGGFRLPPVFNGPPGTYLWGDKCPTTSSGNDVFLNVVGRNPIASEQFTALDGLTQSYVVSTYLPDGTWDHVPSLHVGQAGFYTILAVPEPHTLGCGIVALLTFSWFRRRSAP